MSTHLHRKCCKCGVTAAQDQTVPFYRFPYPGQNNILKVKAWAIYCWPEKEWNNVDLLRLHTQSKMLCGRHFEDSCFLDSSKKKIGKFAVPGTAEYVRDLMQTLRRQIILEAQDIQSGSVCTDVADPSTHRDGPKCSGKEEPPAAISNDSTSLDHNYILKTSECRDIPTEKIDVGSFDNDITNENWQEVMTLDDEDDDTAIQLLSSNNASATTTLNSNHFFVENVQNNIQPGRKITLPRDILLRKKMKGLNQKIKRRQNRIKHLQSIVDMMREYAKQPEIENILNGNFKNICKILNRTPPIAKGHKYSDKVKEFAYTVHSYSPKAYEYLCTVMRLPSKSTLRGITRESQEKVQVEILNETREETQETEETEDGNKQVLYMPTLDDTREEILVEYEILDSTKANRDTRRITRRHR